MIIRIMLLLGFIVSAQELNITTSFTELEAQVLDILADLTETRQDLEYQFDVLAKISFNQTIANMIQTVKNYTIKTRRTNSKINKITDVAILDVFNSELERKRDLANSQLNGIEKHLDKGTMTNRLEKIIDFWYKRSQVPDKDLEIVVQMVEKKAGQIQYLLKKTYSLNWIYILLVIIAVGAILILKGVIQAQKRHIF
ncbi:unnamed protein product [Blepharisma stoltei]|uniref:Uncharacterized protein n=1 Tax=Blepharisma stoltei TaxID=1481888 RepID=A0AAU9IQ25_9CILI|nr:unnamed protein product [Blepharisma stoltei]